MFHLGNASKGHLSQAHEDLQLLVSVAIRTAPFDFSVTESFRDRIKQDDYFARGLSKVQYPDSLHNRTPAMAVHLVPYMGRESPYPQKDDPQGVQTKKTAQFYVLANHIKVTADYLEMNIRHGGDWNRDGNYFDQDFDDLAHFELIDW